MKALYGFANTSAHELAIFLRRKGLSVAVYDLTDDPLEKDVVFFTNVHRAMTVSSDLQKYQGVVIVTDSPVRLDGLVGLKMMDVAEARTSFTYTFIRPDLEAFAETIEKALEDEDGAVVPHLREAALLPVLLRSTSASMMQGVQTFIYTLPHENRDEVKTAFFQWFLAPDSVTLDKLRRRWKRLLPTVQDTRIDRVLDGAPLEKLREALRYVTETKMPGAKITAYAADLGISAFDIRYIQAAHLRMEKEAADVETGMTLGDIRRAALAQSKTKKSSTTPAPQPAADVEDGLDDDAALLEDA